MKLNISFICNDHVTMTSLYLYLSIMCYCLQRPVWLYVAYVLFFLIYTDWRKVECSPLSCSSHVEIHDGRLVFHNTLPPPILLGTIPMAPAKVSFAIPTHNPQLLWRATPPLSPHLFLNIYVYPLYCSIFGGHHENACMRILNSLTLVDCVSLYSIVWYLLFKHAHSFQLFEIV